MSSILQGGRLGTTKRDVVNFISSLEDDVRIAHATVLVNEAHVIALLKAKAIPKGDARKLLRALRQLERRIPLRRGVEDIHVVIEEYVTKHSSRDVGGRLHIGKSRNDQVATAIRIVLRDELLAVSNHLLSLETELLRLASKHLESVFPGYTHMQPAQPISFAHYLVAIGDSFLRDNQRVMEAYRRVNKSPMGSAALAGTSFRLDRRLVARLLGFNGFVENTLDAVSSRDFALEALSTLTILASNLSRVAQDLIFYSSADVSLLHIPDEFASTSSIMPQKKNPDPLELIRARSARIAGNFNAAVSVIHGLPSGYNLDFQEITPLLWHSCDMVNSCLKILTQLIPGIRLNTAFARRDYLQHTAATEITNILVREERVPFRTAHRAVGRCVRMILERKRSLLEVTQVEWKAALQRRLSRRTIVLITKALDLKRHLSLYRTSGSPTPRRTAAMIRSRTVRVRAMHEGNSLIGAKLQSSLRKFRSVIEQSLS